MKDKMSYYETHAHYHHKKLRNKLNVLLPQLESADIGKIIEIPISLDSNAEVIQLKKEVNAMGYTDLFSFAVGVHPNCITWTTSDDEQVEDILKQYIANNVDAVVAVGETGLDYYRCDGLEERKRQQIWFRKQIELALEFHLPLILHIRDAHEQALPILEEYHKIHPQLHGVCHCFTGDSQVAKQYIDKGFLLGIGGMVTHEVSTELRECVESVDLRYIVLETDSPYLKPECVKGKVNTSLNLSVICECIATLKEIDKQVVEQVTYENACRLFGKCIRYQ